MNYDIEENKGKNSLLVMLEKYFASVDMIWLAIVGIVFIGAISSRGVFVTSTNLLNILRQSADIGILAIGQTLVIITGGIDLSVGSLVAFSSVVVANFMKSGYSIGASILVSLAICSLLGGITGLSVSKGKIPPFISSLAMMSIAKGLAMSYAQGQPIYGFPNDFLIFGRGSVGFIPAQVMIWLVMVLVVLVLLERTRWGRYIFMVGGNERATWLTGVNTDMVKLLVFIISGFMAGVGGIILTSRLNMGAPFLGESMELDSITAVVLGGTSLKGGMGSIVGTFGGAIFLGMINNLMNVLNVNPLLQGAVKGVIMLGAVCLSTRKESTGSL